MRQKKEAVLSFGSNDDGLPKIVRDYRAGYRMISQVLDRNPEIPDAVHQDVKHLSQGGSKGRKGDFTAENILRALIVQDLEGLPFREAVIRIGGDGFRQDFLRMRKKAVMDFTFLDKFFPAIRPETWKRGNELPGRYGVGQGTVNPKLIRTRIERHEKLFGERPKVLAADKGFCPEKSKFEELAKLVANLAIPRRMQDFMDKVLAHRQTFRAGIEGTISGLKRAFRRVRCLFCGFKGFAGSVGLGVFCHNLIVLADHESG